MLATAASRHLWDGCLELEAYIHSHHVNSVYRLDGEVLEKYMSGEAVDISHFFKLAWCNWIMHQQGIFDYPDKLLHLWKYLGPDLVWNSNDCKFTPALCGSGLLEYLRPLTVEERLI